jgi:DNA-binding GntR family transcriptional regulator
VLLRLVDIFYLMTQRRREYFFRGLDRRRQSFTEHQKIFEAVVERDEERAVALLDAHLQGAESHWQDLIRP